MLPTEAIRRLLPTEAIRRLLPHTWHAFFGRFGQLRPVQRLAIPRLMDGENLLVTAPTAAGKTEALVGPLLERAFAVRPTADLGLDTLVVSPTRALCNDLARRLRGPVSSCGLRLAIKTADFSSFNEQAPPHLLITTPESLDSLLCRRPGVLRGVRGLLLDELHLVDGTARGDQLLCLLSRLSRVAASAPQRCAASATIPAAGDVARLYLGADAETVAAPGAFANGDQRQIAAECRQAFTIGEASAAIEGLFAQAPKRKILVFANRRTDVEALVGLLSVRPALSGRVLAHHGSLSRGERLRVEQRFLDAPSAVCIATMTLEIGIDISDVDRVVLLGPPPNVGSLLQRVGRSNRSEATAHVLCLYADAFDRHRFEHLLACARRGQLFAERLPFRPAVVAQQALSLLFQNPGRWVSAGALSDRLPEAVRKAFDRDACQAVLAGLVEQEMLRAVGNRRFTAEEPAERMYELGRLHTNIDESPELEIVDQTTGRTVGTARFSRVDRRRAEAGGDVAIGLGGRRREVTRLAGRQVIVESVPGSEEAQFVARQAPRYSYGLARDLAGHLGIPADTLVLQKLEGDGAWRVGHFLGTVWGRLLGGLWAGRGLSKRVRAGAFFLQLERPPDEPHLGERTVVLRELERTIDRHLMTLARQLQPGPFGRGVPRPLTRRWVRACVQLEELADVLSKARLVDEATLDGRSGV